MAVGMEGRAENRIGALPRLQVAFLCMTDAAHFYTVCSLFSYAGVLTADMHWTEDKNDAGFVAGWLQSANVCGRIVTSSLWGLKMQRHGPKPVLAATLFGLLAGGILFSFCTNLAGAMCIRFIFLGMFNGWPVLVAPCAAAVAGDARQTQVLGLIIACGSGTQLVGPGIGGWTYGLVPGYPAMLPSSIGCILAIATIAVFLRVRRAFELVEEEEATPKLRRSSKAALFRFPVPLLLWMRFCQGFAVFGVYEAIPLWLISDKALGGLGLSEKEVGSLLSRSGLWTLEHHLLLLHHAISDSQAPFASLLFDPHQLHCGCHSRAAALCLDGASGERAAPDFCLHVRFPSRCQHAIHQQCHGSPRPICHHRCGRHGGNHRQSLVASGHVLVIRLVLAAFREGGS